ncbi:MAG: prephenate dehydrogenase/arogenate dehydrogenase family protein [Chloroflexi bacterium]|nr:prephenate dehydrogenase/arogenate dehydrogenase family protein [Chloroflexota bacterium]
MKSRVTIVGLGLIGGSIGLALKNSKADLEIIGHDKDPGVSGRAIKRGAVDKTNWNLPGACDGAGFIILALPLDAIKDTLAALKPILLPGVIVTDTATTKAPVLEWAKDLPDGVHFVGGHPVLKADRTITGHGIDAADATLFEGATYCLAPSVNAASQVIDVVSNFVTMLGAKPYFIDANEHDGLTASVQQLPALLGTALASLTMLSSGWRELGKVAGADLRAATEFVPSDGKTAREQFLAHRTDLIRLIDTATEKLNDLRGLVEREDAAALETLIDSINTKREEWLSGNLEKSETSSISFESVQTSTARLFLGGLASRTPKPK